METFIASTGIRITYERRGSGPPIVLVHGGCADARAWRSIGAYLEADHLLLCPNTLGYGGSDDRASGVAPTHAPNRAVLSELLRGLGQPLVLVGHSGGGSLAFDLALNTCLPIVRLVLFESTPPAVFRAVGDWDGYQRLVDIFLDGSVAMARRGDERAMEVMYDAWSGAGAFHRLPAKVKSALVTLAEKGADDIEAGFNDSIDLHSLAAMTVPTLVVTGDAGEKLAVDFADHLVASLPDCRHHLLPGADHSLIVSHAGECARLITQSGTGPSGVFVSASDHSSSV